LSNDLYLNTDGAPLATEGGTPLQRHHQFGFYAMAQQRMWAQGGSESRGISVFANFVQADRRIAEIEQIAEVGLLWTGPTSWRPQDDLGVTVGRAHVNSLIAESATLYNSQLPPTAGRANPIPDNEYPVEVHYSVNVTSAITVRPNIQFVHAPGGIQEAEDVVVFGLHLSIYFEGALHVFQADLARHTSASRAG
jgi:porin